MNARELARQAYRRPAASPTAFIFALPFIAAAAIVCALAWALAILYAMARELIRAALPDGPPDPNRCRTFER